MKNIIICEKPSVARTIMSYLGGFTNHSDKGIGYGESDEWIVTWCFGHLITMCYPEDYDESLKTWSLDALPFLPDTYKYRPIQDTIKQFEIIKTIYHRTDVRTLYYCPDPAREGVLIQHLVRQMAGLTPGIEEKVMWISSQTEEEVMRALREAKPVEAYNDIRDAAVARNIEDYAFGINFSRGLSKRFEKTTGGKLPVAVGRVMTAVLGLVVDREREIENFVPTNFYKINTTLNGANVTLGWKATETNPIYPKIEPFLYNDTGFKNKRFAEQFAAGLGRNQIVESKDVKTEQKSAPLLFNLAELQMTCSRMFKISPSQTLTIIQGLYEKKMLTYPRTDARYLSTAIAKEIDENIQSLVRYHDSSISGAASSIMASGSYKNIANTRYTNDSKIEDHYAIIPTGENLSLVSKLEPIEKDVFELIVRRFLSIFMPPAEYEKTSIITKDDARGERFYLSGSVLKNPGYLTVAGIPQQKDGLPESAKNLVAGQTFACGYSVTEGTTNPPKHYTTDTLIGAMENAGKFIEDEELREQIKGSGIGTSATRGATLDKLVANEYLKLNNKTQVISVAPFGYVVYEIVHQTIPDLLNPKMTAEWERGLSLVADGKMSQDKYINKLNQYISHYIDVIKATEPNQIVAELAKKLPDRPGKAKGPSKDNVQTYLDVPWDDKDEVKKLGAWFDMQKKAWYVPKNADISKFEKWLPGGKVTKTVKSAKKIYLDVPFDDKETAKGLGARWDNDKKKWYALSNNPNIETLKKWA